MKITSKRLDEIILEEIENVNEDIAGSKADIFLDQAIRAYAEEMGGVRDINGLSKLRDTLLAKANKRLKKLLKIGEKVNLEEVLSAVEKNDGE